MTFEEKGVEKSKESNVVDMDCSELELLSQNKDAKSISKQGSVRTKMEAMQKRINELKEKVKYEGELLYSKETDFRPDVIGSKSLDSLSNFKSKDSLSEDFNNFEEKIRENEDHSDKSLYFSASSYSMCSMSSNSSDSTYNSFTKFVDNFIKNQDHKERLNLLQLHSKNQISQNMLKTSLLELESRCCEELDLVERSLKHLSKLAEELNMEKEQPKEDNNRYGLKALDFNCSGDHKLWRPTTKASSKYLPLREDSKTEIESIKDPDILKCNLPNGFIS